MAITYYTDALATFVCVYWQDSSQPALRNLPTHEVQSSQQQPQPVEDLTPHEVTASAAPQPVENVPTHEVQACAAPKPAEVLPPSKRTQMYLKEAAAKRKAATVAPVAEQEKEQKSHTSDEPAPTDEAPVHPSSELAKSDPAPETHSQGNAAVEPPPTAEAGNEVPLVGEPTLPTPAPESPVQASSPEKAKPTDESTTNQGPVDQTLALLESLSDETTKAVPDQEPELSRPADKADEPSTTADTPGTVSQTLVVDSLPRPVEESKKDSTTAQLIAIEDRTGFNGYGDGFTSENKSSSLSRMHLVSTQLVK